MKTIYGFGNSDSAKLLVAPFDFAYTGTYDYSDGELLSTSIGYYWSRTAKNASDAYVPLFYSGYVYPQSYGPRGNGRPVRCVGSKLLALPLEFGYTGFFNLEYGCLINEGSGGGFWSRTAASGVNARRLGLGASAVAPQVSNARGDGRAVRWLGR